mgnify:FL=1
MSGSSQKSEDRRDGISPELDELSSELMGDAFDILADGGELNVRVVVEDEARNVASYEFADDGPEALLDGAHRRIVALVKQAGDAEQGLGNPLRYALVYEGAIADVEGAYQDALILEFGEKNYRSFSAYSLVDGKGEGEGFRWTEPAPAGELEPLL